MAEQVIRHSQGGDPLRAVTSTAGGNPAHIQEITQVDQTGAAIDPRQIRTLTAADIVSAGRPGGQAVTPLASSARGTNFSPGSGQPGAGSGPGTMGIYAEAFADFVFPQNITGASGAVLNQSALSQSGGGVAIAGGASSAITSGGTGYPASGSVAVVFTGGTGTGCTGHATVSAGGVLTGVVIDTPGTSYTSGAGLPTMTVVSSFSSTGAMPPTGIDFFLQRQAADYSYLLIGGPYTVTPAMIAANSGTQAILALTIGAAVAVPTPNPFPPTAVSLVGVNSYVYNINLGFDLHLCVLWRVNGGAATPTVQFSLALGGK